MPFYDKDGNEIADVVSALTPEQIDAIVNASPKYQDTLQETIQRRKTIKEQKAELEKLSAKVGTTLEQANEATQDKTVDPAKPVTVDEEALTEKVLGKLTAIEKAKADRAAAIDAILTEKKIPLTKEFRMIIGAGTDDDHMRSLADAIVHTSLRFEDVPGGNGKTDVDAEGTMAKVKARLFPNSK